MKSLESKQVVVFIWIQPLMQQMLLCFVSFFFFLPWTELKKDTDAITTSLSNSTHSDRLYLWTFLYLWSGFASFQRTMREDPGRLKATTVPKGGTSLSLHAFHAFLFLHFLRNVQNYGIDVSPPPPSPLRCWIIGPSPFSLSRSHLNHRWCFDSSWSHVTSNSLSAKMSLSSAPLAAYLFFSEV